MTFNATELLLAFYDNIDIFLLILIRMIGFVMVLPVLSGTNVPNVTKVGLCIFLAVIVLSSGTARQATYDDTLFGYIFLMVKEFLVGFITAFLVYMVFSVFYFVGQLVDFQIGFSMVSVFDPMIQIQVPITGNLFYLVISMLFVQSGGLRNMIYTIAKSYTILPIGKASLISNAAVMRYILDIMVNYFLIGIQFALPIVGTVLIVDIALGLLTKAVPQMNVFVVGMPIKLLVGLIVLYMIAPAFGSMYSYLYTEATRFMMNVLRGMMP